MSEDVPLIGFKASITRSFDAGVVCAARILRQRSTHRDGNTRRFTHNGRCPVYAQANDSQCFFGPGPFRRGTAPASEGSIDRDRMAGRAIPAAEDAAPELTSSAVLRRAAQRDVRGLGRI
jgi:hypothetical protein